MSLDSGIKVLRILEAANRAACSGCDGKAAASHWRACLTVSAIRISCIQGSVKMAQRRHSMGLSRHSMGLSRHSMGLSRLSDSLGSLGNMEHLELRRCGFFTDLTDIFGSLGNLQRLELDTRQFRIPDIFGSLQSLRHLELQGLIFLLAYLKASAN
jgi:hypothetical protein